MLLAKLQHCHTVSKAAAPPCYCPSHRHVVVKATAIMLPKPLHHHAVSKAAALSCCWRSRLQLQVVAGTFN